MPDDLAEETTDPRTANEVWTADGQHVERMLYAGNRLDKAQAEFEAFAKVAGSLVDADACLHTDQFSGPPDQYGAILWPVHRGAMPSGDRKADSSHRDDAAVKMPALQQVFG
ncbi:hypothetical protein [Bradyrhizobium sp.]|jgi:hypothetical protein|uniref:hypothetical protein n=1 Tax=Bradyrhizobium sp. TaxID=376 RepID=UPI003C4BF597